MAAFARKVAHLVEVERVVDPDGTTAFYSVTGELFFASDQELIDAFRIEDPDRNVDLCRLLFKLDGDKDPRERAA
jgi:SulP family sulfate permease